LLFALAQWARMQPSRIVDAVFSRIFPAAPNMQPDKRRMLLELWAISIGNPPNGGNGNAQFEPLNRFREAYGLSLQDISTAEAIVNEGIASSRMMEGIERFSAVPPAAAPQRWEESLTEAEEKLPSDGFRVLIYLRLAEKFKNLPRQERQKKLDVLLGKAAAMTNPECRFILLNKLAQQLETLMPRNRPAA
jgi:hypothetical protein